jgi:hypothetical protein
MQNEHSTNVRGIYTHGKMVNNKYYNKYKYYNYQILTHPHDSYTYTNKQNKLSITSHSRTPTHREHTTVPDRNPKHREHTTVSDRNPKHREHTTVSDRKPTHARTLHPHRNDPHRNDKRVNQTLVKYRPLHVADALCLWST